MILFNVKPIPKKLTLLILVCIFLLVYISFTKIDIVSPGTGVITGVTDNLEILSPDSGFINKFDYKTGSSVKKGDVLFSYTNLDVFHQEKTLKGLVTFADKRISELEEDQRLLKIILSGEIKDKQEFASQENSNINRELSAYKFINEYISLLNEEGNLKLREEKMLEEKKDLGSRILLLKRKGRLLTNAGAPEIDIINNQEEISQIDSQITSGDINLLSLQNDSKLALNKFERTVLEQLNNNDNQLQQLKKERIENSGQLDLLRNKIRANSVISPISGVILSIERNFDKGSYVEASKPVMTIKKKNEKQVIDAKVLAKYRPFIYNKAAVKIIVNSPGFNRSIIGSVTKISADSFADDERKEGERYYRVEINPVKGEKISPELEGVQVSTYIVSKRITLLSYMTALVGDNLVFNVW